MTLILQVNERKLLPGEKKWRLKILGIIRIDDTRKEFIFGRNEQTKEFLANIYAYPFLKENQGVFSGSGKHYTFLDTSHGEISLRTQLSFWIFHFGVGETGFERGRAMEIKVGDTFVSKNKTKRIELVLEVIRMY